MKMLLTLLAPALLSAQMYYAPSAMHNHQRVPATGLMAYYAAGSLGLIDAASVTSWTDLAGRNTASGGTAPTFSTSQFAGRPAVQFASASSQYLTAGNVNNLAAATQITAFVVAMPGASMPTWGSVFGKGASYLFGQNTTTGVLSFSGKQNLATSKVNGQTSYWWQANQPAMFQMVDYRTTASSGSDHTWYFSSGWAKDTTHVSTNSLTPSSSTSAFLLGSQAASNDFFNGYIGAAGIYSTAPSTGDRERLVRALCTQYSLYCPPTGLDPDRALAPYASSALTLPAVYDKSVGATGTLEVVQPDVIYFPSGWNSHKWWMAVTGYSTHIYSTSERNNVLYSDDGTTWTVAKNNLCDQADGGVYNDADPGFYFDSSASTLYVFSLHTYANGVNGCAAGSGKLCESISYQYSTDGTTWGCSADIITGTATASIMTTPNVLYNAAYSRWEMFTVNRDAARIERRISTVGPTSGWSDPAPARISYSGLIGSSFLPPNHICVRLENGVYYASIYTMTTIPAARLYFATSLDGLTWWQQRSPQFSGSDPIWSARGKYKGSLVRVTPGQWELFYTGYDDTPHWRIGRTTISGL
jgi:hypothetical protein